MTPKIGYITVGFIPSKHSGNLRQIFCNKITTYPPIKPAMIAPKIPGLGIFCRYILFNNIAAPPARATANPC